MRDPAGNALYFILIVEDISHCKLAEISLRESEEKFRQLADNIPEVFWMADIEMRKLLYLSPVYEKVTGKSVADAMKRLSSFLEIVHPDDKRRALDRADRPGRGVGVQHGPIGVWIAVDDFGTGYSSLSTSGGSRSARSVRIMCSAVADFKIVTDAVNKGEIFRFLPKDADPRRLRMDVREALFSRANA